MSRFVISLFIPICKYAIQQRIDDKSKERKKKNKNTHWFLSGRFIYYYRNLYLFRLFRRIINIYEV